MTVDQSSIDTDKTAVSINLLDTVSGTLYYHGTVDGAGPVSLETDFKRFGGYMSSINVMLCENWLIATYYNHGPDAAFDPYSKVPNSKNVELFVMEVFESAFPDDRQR